MAVSAPSAITQFLAIAEAALPSNFQVRYSTIWSVDVEPQALLVDEVRFSQDEMMVLGPGYEHEEHFNIRCHLFSFYEQDTDDPSDELNRMTEVFGYYLSVQVAVANNPTLNSTVRLAWPRQLDFSPAPAAQGWSGGQLDFEIECQVRKSSLS